MENKELKDKGSLQYFLRLHGFPDEHSPLNNNILVYPIHLAVRLGDVEMVRILLQAKVDPEQTGFMGKTAMDIASEKRLAVSCHRRLEKPRHSGTRACFRRPDRLLILCQQLFEWAKILTDKQKTHGIGRK